MIALEDLQDHTEQEVIDHIASEYSGDRENSTPTEEQIQKTKQILEQCDILIAYESVGSWGCDSSSFFLFKDKKTGGLYELNGSHCSCYGFEGQFDLEMTTLESLKKRNENEYGVFYTGGYDTNESENKKKVKEFIDLL